MAAKGTELSLHIRSSSLDYVASVIEEHGLEYAFRIHSGFGEVDDPEFHRLRRAYCKSAKKLLDYVEEHWDD